MQPEGATILGDWGTTNVRLWLVGDDGVILDSLTTQDVENVSSGKTSKEAFDRITQHWRRSAAPRFAILCGMIGRKGGWIEAPYLPTDRWRALAGNLVRKSNGAMDIFVVPGLRTLRSDDVMRGEETQILGFLDETPEFTGAVCLPGTHSKWCELSRGEITGFRTEMTGELFGLLSKRSTLHDAIVAGHNEKAFDCGVEEGLNTSDAMQGLFSIRANWLLKNTEPEVGYSRLSGMLIGAEIARRACASGIQEAAIIGSDSLAALYERALKQAGISSTMYSGERLVVRGLQRIARDAREMVDG